MPIVKSLENALQLASSSLLCLDREDLWVSGSTDKENASLIEVDLIMCTEHDYCRSEEEIKTFFGNSFMFFLKNQMSFDQNRFGSDSVVLESRLDSIKLGAWKRQQIYEVTKTTL